MASLVTVGMGHSGSTEGQVSLTAGGTPQARLQGEMTPGRNLERQRCCLGRWRGSVKGIAEGNRGGHRSGDVPWQGSIQELKYGQSRGHAKYNKNRHETGPVNSPSGMRGSIPGPP